MSGADMRCFVAMAFGRQDIDELYDTAIYEILRRRGIDPVRVDRVEHNEDIDAQIVQEIKTADLAIADLTYARPSVYYEAGYAERAIPVIYTIRSDHLEPRTGDEFGNHRLHFDLQMKNVIDWRDPGDRAFRAKLDSRVGYILAPLLEKGYRKDQEAAEAAAFQSLPIAGRIDAIMKVAATVMAELGFTAASKANGALNWRGHANSYIRLKDGILSLIELSVHTKTGELPHHFVDKEPPYNLNFRRTLNQLVSVRERRIECAFFAIPYLEVCHLMPTFSASPDRKLLAFDSSLDVPTFDPNDTGEVFIGNEFVRDGTWGSKLRYGFHVRSVPAGALSIKGDLLMKGFRFVYGDLKHRAVPRRIEYQLIDAIDSDTSFARRLKREVVAFADERTAESVHRAN
jgi:hypothetical protein